MTSADTVSPSRPLQPPTEDLFSHFPDQDFRRAHAALDAKQFQVCADLCADLQRRGHHLPVLDYMMGVSLFQLGEREIGTAMIGVAAQSQPDNLLLRIDHANSLACIGLLPRAIQTLIDGIKIHGPHPDIALRLSRFFSDTGQHHKSQLLLVSSISANPTRVDLCCQLATELAAELKTNEAMTLMELSNFLCGDTPGITSSMAVLEQARGNYDEAIRHYEHTLELEPDHALAHANLSTALLTQNEFKRSFQEAEWRLKTRTMRVADVPAPRWTGEDLTGKTLLITAEQGFGDMIQYCRFLRRLPLHDTKVIIEIHPGLERLMQRLPGVTQVITICDDPVYPPCDYTIPMVSLPLVVGCDEPWLRSNTRYIDLPQPMALPRSGQPNGSLKVGLTWASRPSTGDVFARRMLNRRSCPLEQISVLCSVTGADFYSLQKGEAVDRLDGLSLPITDLSSRLGDFMDTAAAMASLDLIITVDTSVAHLAGALGRPVWVLLSAGQIDYRWGTSDDTPWYPHARLYRAGAGGWAGLLNQVAIDLQKYANDHGGHNNNAPAETPL